MLNAHISAIYLQKYKKNQKKRFYGWILFAGRTWFNFICKQGDNEDVFSVILGSKYIVSLHLTLYLILNLNFNLTFCNLLFFFRLLAMLSSVFYVLPFGVFIWVLVLAILLTFRIYLAYFSKKIENIIKPSIPRYRGQAYLSRPASGKGKHELNST